MPEKVTITQLPRTTLITVEVIIETVEDVKKLLAR